MKKRWKRANITIFDTNEYVIDLLFGPLAGWDAHDVCQFTAFYSLRDALNGEVGSRASPKTYEHPTAHMIIHCFVSCQLFWIGCSHG